MICPKCSTRMFTKVGADYECYNCGKMVFLEPPVEKPNSALGVIKSRSHFGCEMKVGRH